MKETTYSVRYKWWRTGVVLVGTLFMIAASGVSIAKDDPGDTADTSSLSKPLPKVCASAPVGENQMRVTLLGTGTPTPSAERFSASTLVQAGGLLLLFDAGRGAAIRLNQALEGPH